MKTIPPLIFFTVFFVPSLFSQPVHRGVYPSFADYQKGNLSYASPCSEKNTIRIRETSLFPTFVIKYISEKIRLYKDSLYAVVVCGQPMVRFQNKECSMHWMLNLKPKMLPHSIRFITSLRSITF